MIEESKLYPTVEEFIRDKYGCFKVKGEVGESKIGYIDVFGVYHKSPARTEIETIGVEIKPKKDPKAAKFGQAKGYSVLFHKTSIAALNFNLKPQRQHIQV